MKRSSDQKFCLQNNSKDYKWSCTVYLTSFAVQLTSDLSYDCDNTHGLVWGIQRLITQFRIKFGAYKEKINTHSKVSWCWDVCKHLVKVSQMATCEGQHTAYHFCRGLCVICSHMLLQGHLCVAHPATVRTCESLRLLHRERFSPVVQVWRGSTWTWHLV